MKTIQIDKATLAALLMAVLVPLASAKVGKETLDAITTPNKVQTSIGTLKFFELYS